MGIRDQSNVELVHAFNKGDSLAFEEFMRRHQDQIFRLALLNLYQSNDAADVTQEVFLRAYKGLKRFRFRSEPMTWLYRTTKNVCMEFNRKASRSENVEDNIDIKSENDMNNELQQRETILAVKELINGLTQRQKDVVMFRIFEELSVDETAKILGCRPGTVKATLNRSIKKMQTSKIINTQDFKCYE